MLLLPILGAWTGEFDFHLRLCLKLLNLKYGEILIKAIS